MEFTPDNFLIIKYFLLVLFIISIVASLYFGQKLKEQILDNTNTYSQIESANTFDITNEAVKIARQSLKEKENRIKLRILACFICAVIIMLTFMICSFKPI